MYLTLALMCFYYARKSKWHLVGITEFFLSLTRSIGVLVVLPLLCKFLMQFLKEKKDIISFKNHRGMILPLFYLSFIPLGTISFMIYNYYLTGDFLAFVHAQGMGGRHAVPLWQLSSTVSTEIFSQPLRQLLPQFRFLFSYYFIRESDFLTGYLVCTLFSSLFLPNYVYASIHFSYFSF